MRRLNGICAFALALIIAAAGVIPAVAHGSEAKQYAENIIEYNLKKSSSDSVQQWIDGELSRDAGAGSEWYIIALGNYGEYDFSAYIAALNGFLRENDVGSASSRLKYALTYIATGDKDNPYIYEALGNSIGEQGIMSLVFGLHLLNNGYCCNAYSADGLVDEILSLQLEDGGFSVTGEYGDVDVTAMTVQALAYGYYGNAAVKATVDGALGFLSDRQLENGGYSAYGVENPESTAQVIIALSALNIDACIDGRFIKNGNTVFDGISKFCLSDGSFCHREGGSSDSTATAQALCAAAAYGNFKNGKSPFYIFNEDENISEKTTDAITAKPADVTETASVQPALSEPTLTTEAAVLNESASEITSTTAIPESEATKNAAAGNNKNKSDTARIIIISVCAASMLICTVLFITKKHKHIAIFLVVTVGITAVIAGICRDDRANTVGTVTISISCNTVKDKGKSHIPKNGIILDETAVEIREGDTAYDILAEACRNNEILLSANSGYIEGINNLFETDFGKSSGWMYFVNGEAPSVGCRGYELSHGDKIEWHYTCDMGKDLDIETENEYN